MGAVWRARDEVLERDVAVKELITPPELAGPEQEMFAVRTFREARAAGRLNHPSIVTVYDVFEDAGHPWIVLELVPSRTLGSVVREDGALPPRQVAKIGLQVLNALRAAHHAGVLHRDVKPDNVLLGAYGRAVLTDFGIATLDDESQLTRTGALIGTPAFIAPERAAGGLAMPASDLWSLGATLYFAVEGVSPFHRNSVLATLGAIMFDHPPLRAAGVLAPIIAGLLRKDPALRMTAGEVELRLHSVLSHADSPLDAGPRTEATPTITAVGGLPDAAPAAAAAAAPVPVPARPRPPVRRVAALATAAVVLSGLVTGVVAYATAHPARPTGSPLLAAAAPLPEVTTSVARQPVTHTPTPTHKPASRRSVPDTSRHVSPRKESSGTPRKPGPGSKTKAHKDHGNHPNKPDKHGKPGKKK
ncbi:serine/threonine protein kinase [Streptosporangiaceae bacterium NEAU-GS5]|nr:serine/threonine protein kinase [Streptosporangiaceae bacterium NEAU-GS5]